MRTLSHLWRSLEAIPGLLAIPAFWEACCGPDIDLVRPHLRVTDTEGSLYPCPKPHVGYCPRRIVDYGNGEFAAICRDPYEICERVPLTQRDVLLQQLDVASFTGMLAGPLAIRWQQPVERGDHTWGIGLSTHRESLNRPVFLFLLPSTERFVASLQRLLLRIPGPCLVVAPTSRHRTVEVQEMLQDRGISFLALEEYLRIDDAGRLVSTDPQEAAAEVRATPKDDRARAVKEFLARHQCKVKDIQEAAAIHQADYYKWLNGSIPDHYSTCVAIEKVLVAGLPKRGKRALS
jgi:hypothetical protein